MTKRKIIYKSCSVNSSIHHAAQALKAGGTVVFPTETVYGLGALALAPEAVARIFEIKRRPRFNPLIVHLPAREWLEQVAQGIPAQAYSLAERFWPGPLTLVLPKKKNISGIVTGGLETVAVRMPAHPLAQELLREVGEPIAAPSANRFTRISPTAVEHARAQLGSEVDVYLDGGPCRLGIESTIVGWVNGKACLLRRGALAVEDIEAITGTLLEAPQSARPLAPGGLPRHYAPQTPLIFSSEPVDFESNRRVALLTFSPEEKEEGGYAEHRYLSKTGDMRQAAAALFATLQELEAQDFDLIVARPLPAHGLGLAINDRLRRAGHTETDLALPV